MRHQQRRVAVGVEHAVDLVEARNADLRNAEFMVSEHQNLAPTGRGHHPLAALPPQPGEHDVPQADHRVVRSHGAAPYPEQALVHVLRILEGPAEDGDRPRVTQVEIRPNPDLLMVLLPEHAGRHPARSPQHAPGRPPVDILADRRLEVLFELLLVQPFQLVGVHDRSRRARVTAALPGAPGAGGPEARRSLRPAPHGPANARRANPWSVFLMPRTRVQTPLPSRSGQPWSLLRVRGRPRGASRA